MTDTQEFAKIVVASDGAQVLFYCSSDERGSPQVRQITEVDGMIIEMNIAFADDDEGWDKRDEWFQAAGQPVADLVRSDIRKIIGD